ncbi:unnamed protein product [Strongylus vulgaris]|uniref:Uncharacterized protein n=1 Tax=Strongylus vulgaris TaxID=40348 RepID=A0A3P7IP29_STRVU|nr:unnamed protein product [Strongylus vulgaris]
MKEEQCQLIDSLKCKVDQLEAEKLDLSMERGRFKALVEELREAKCLADTRVEELEEQESELLGKV